MSIAAGLRAQILAFVLEQGKVDLAAVYRRFDLVSKRAMDDHIVALVEAGKVTRTTHEVAPVKSTVQKIMDGEMWPKPVRRVVKPAAPSLPVTNPRMRHCDRIMTLFQHRRTITADEVYRAIPEVPNTVLYQSLRWLTASGRLKVNGRTYTCVGEAALSLIQRVDAWFDDGRRGRRKEVARSFPEHSPSSVGSALRRLREKGRLARESYMFQRAPGAEL